MYDDLDTNVPRAMMEFSDHSWDPETPLFPRREAVQGYLQDYMKGLEKLIVFDTEVIDVHHRITEEGRKWVIETRNVHLPKVNKVEYFDYVVVATGNFGKPWVPMIPGLREWADTYPKSVLHAKSYKNPESFAGRVSAPRTTTLLHPIDKFAETPSCRKWFLWSGHFSSVAR